MFATVDGGAAVVVPHGPAAGAPHGVSGRDADAGDVADAGERQLLVADGEPAEHHRANEAAPEDEPAAAEEVADVVRDDEHVVELRPNQRAQYGGEDEIPDGRRVVPAPRQLPLGDDLRDHEGEQHREAEPREFERAERDAERVVDDLGVGHGGKISERSDGEGPGVWGLGSGF
jgi:hypothetical protein